MLEVFKDIPSFPGYQVSNLGRIKSLKGKISGKGFTKEDKILKPIQRTQRRYLQVSLYLNDGSKSLRKRYVHRLVGITFIPNPKNLPQINHDDLDPTNNMVDNLTWVTGKQNSKHYHKFNNYINNL